MCVCDMSSILWLVFCLSAIGNSGVFAAPIVKPGNPLNLFKKFVPKKTGMLNHPSLSNAATAAASLASTVRRTTRREVNFHRVKVTGSSPVPSLVLDGDKSHSDDEATTTYDWNVAGVVESGAQPEYSVSEGDGCNTRVSEPRATATEVNGRALTGYPVFLKNYESDGPGEWDKYYDVEDRPGTEWKTGIDGSFKVARRNSAEEDEDNDDDER